MSFTYLSRLQANGQSSFLFCWLLFICAFSAAQDAQESKTRTMVHSASHVLLLKPEGTIWAAGERNDGARGDISEPEYRSEFRKLDSLPIARQIAATENTSAALAADGSVLVWGMFDYFGPNQPQRPSYDVPRTIQGLKDVVQIALGSNFLVALRNDGTVAVAGSGAYGLRGPGREDFDPTPFADIPLGNDNVAVAACLNTAFAVKRDGTVWGWGSRFGSLLGRNAKWSFLGSDDYRNPKPIQVLGLQNIVSLEGGHRHVLGLTKQGEVFAWGDNEDGALGVPKIEGIGETYYQYPTKIRGLPRITSISAGYDYSLAVDDRGAVWAWGSNTYGCLGIQEDKVEGQLDPIRVPEMVDAESVFAGDYQAFAVLKDGRLAGWGSNMEGGTVISRTVRTQFVPPTIFAIP